MVPLSDKEQVIKKIIGKIDYMLSGINQHSDTQMDCSISQAVRDLSEAYKNLTVEEDI